VASSTTPTRSPERWVEHASTFNTFLLEFLGRAERAYQLRVAEETQLDEALAG